MPISITVHYCNVSVVKFQKMSSSSSSGISGITCGENCIAIHTVICCKTFPCAIPPHNCAFHIGSFNFILEEEAKLKDFEAILIEALKNKGFTDLRLSKMRLLNIQKMPERYHEVLYVDNRQLLSDFMRIVMLNLIPCNSCIFTKSFCNKLANQHKNGVFFIFDLSHLLNFVSSKFSTD